MGWGRLRLRQRGAEGNGRELQRRLVGADPVDLEPGHEGGPGAGHLEQADADQHGPADPGHQASPPPGESEHPHRQLEASSETNRNGMPRPRA